MKKQHCVMKKLFFYHLPIAYLQITILKNLGVRKKLKNHEAAIQELKRVDASILDDTLKSLIYYEIALNNFLIERYENTLFYLEKIEDYSFRFSQQNRWLKVLALNELESWEEAEKEFSILLTEKNIVDTVGLYSFTQNTNFFKSEKKAKFLSLIPGLGQFYAGNVWKGLLSISLNSLFFYFSINSIISRHFASLVLIETPLFFKFYLGGMHNAQEIVQDKNYKIKTKIKSNIQDFIIQNQ